MYIRTQALLQSMSSMHTQRHMLWSYVQVPQMLWMGSRYMLWNLKCSPISEKSDVTCDACSAQQSQQSTPPTRSRVPAPPTKQIGDHMLYVILHVCL